MRADFLKIINNVSKKISGAESTERRVGQG